MSEMIERAAKEIYESKLLVHPRQPWIDGKATATEVFCMQAARAAIKAMREPTNKMVKAAAKSLSEDKRPTPEYIPVREKHRHRWRVMIDAALGDK